MKATEQYFPVVLFVMLQKMVLTFESMNWILMCDDSIGSFLASFLLMLSGFQYFTERNSEL